MLFVCSFSLVLLLELFCVDICGFLVFVLAVVFPRHCLFHFHMLENVSVWESSSKTRKCRSVGKWIQSTSSGLMELQMLARITTLMVIFVEVRMVNSETTLVLWFDQVYTEAKLSEMFCFSLHRFYFSIF